MRRFTRLYFELDATNRTGEKVAALERYFAEAPPADAAWALYFLTGRRLKRAIPYMRLREWAAEAAGLPLWLLDECYDAVGDLSETIALLLPSFRPEASGRETALLRPGAEGEMARWRDNGTADGGMAGWRDTGKSDNAQTVLEPAAFEATESAREPEVADAVPLSRPRAIA